ncbi:MAG: UbiA family prenyltransferase [Candidatus Hodarchaeota archaeon]
MSLIKDISDLLRISLCFLASFVILLAGYISYRFNRINETNGITQNFLQFILQNEIVPIEGILLGVFVPFLLIGGTHVINDYYDFENDKLNQRSDRPLVRGTIKPKTARNLAISFYILAILITIVEVIIYQLSILFILAALFFAILGIGYNLGIKKYGILGNIWVSTGYVAPFLMGTIIVGLVNDWVILNVLVLCFFILFLALGREILKDIMDIEGDIATGKRSVAIVMGPSSAARISGVIYVLSVISGSLMLFLGFRNNWVFFIGFILLVFLLMATTIMLIQKPTLENAVKGRKYTRWSLWWATALIFLSSFFVA